MARNTRLLIWRAPDLSRFGFDEARRLRLPDGCRLDVLDLDADDCFAALRVTWPRDSVTRVAVERSIEDWWRHLGRATRPLAPVVLLRPVPPGRSGPEMPSTPATPSVARWNVRTLLARALHELQEDFDAALTRKLEQLLGKAEAPATKPRAAKRRGPRAPKAPRVRRAEAAAARAARDAEVRARILAALDDGQPRSRGELLSAARLFEDQVPIVLRELRALHGQGVIELRGSRPATKYVLVQAARTTR